MQALQEQLPVGMRPILRMSTKVDPDDFVSKPNTDFIPG
jgi:hypothetical protein